MLIGSTTVGSSVDSHSGGLANINSYEALMSGTVGHLSAFIVSGSASEVFLGLYADNAGGPGKLLAVGALDPDWANIGSGAWRTATVSPQVAVTQGTAYWIAILSPAAGGGVNFAYYTQSVDAFSTWEHSESAALSDLPCNWTGQSGPVSNGTECSMYASP